MFKSTAPRSTAIGLAAAVTLAMLGSINLLASEPSPDALLAKKNVEHRVVLVAVQRPQG